MDGEDPISQFFPGEESVDLYAVLSLEETATSEEIRKAYRRLALLHHPDKHSTASDAAKAAASIKFQQIGFTYAVLGDDKRRARYDATGRTDEGLEALAEGEGGWEQYFEAVFEKVTRDKLDQMKKEYQGSEEEKSDLRKAYVDSKGSIDDIMATIPHSSHVDEARFTTIISALIKSRDLESYPTWEKGLKDHKARKAREKKGESEAKEAELAAKELGVWDEFYGSGKPTAKKSKTKGKGKGAGAKEEGEEAAEDDVEGLRALIQRKQSKNMDSFFDGLAAKYGGDAGPSSSTSAKANAKGGRKRKASATEQNVDDVEAVQSSPNKKTKRSANVIPPPPDIDDAEFERLQRKLFGGKEGKEVDVGDAAKAETKPGGSKGRTKRGKK